MREHGLDFADAHLVYENPRKFTFDVRPKGEQQQAKSIKSAGSGV